jgi:NAD(P)H-quinone oxidoreductase subunit 5
VTIGAVLLFVLAGNLWQLVIGWICTSLALHQLLVFYADRPRAVHAARKKYVLARVADVCLTLAAILVGRAFGTADIGRINADAALAYASGSVPDGVPAAAVLIVIAAALKSAVFPFHGWLLEVMETPTPVSALLHAGLLNAGVYLVVRLGSVVSLDSAALIVLIVVGAVTAIIASSAMVTQASVKVSLAYSSAAHMGFMLMLCGFGAHSVVIMHLIAHSCYKAHAFLSSGSVVDYVYGVGSKKLNTVPRLGQIVVSSLVAVAVLVAISWLLNIDLTKRAGEFALAVTFSMAMTYLFVKGTTGQTSAYTIGMSTMLVALVTLAFWALELTAAAVLGPAVSTIAAPGNGVIATMVIALASFGVVSFLSMQLPALYATAAWKSLYVHLKNGFYTNAIFDRMIARMRGQRLS